MTSRLYPGWYIVGISAFIYMLLVGTTYASFGLYVIPVSHDFGLSRADTNTAFILLQLGGALCAPFVGRAMDRFPARRIIAVGAILYALSFALLALSRSIWFSAAILLILLPVAAAAAGGLSFSVILVRWFSANRGKAMLFFSLGGSLSTIIIIPLLAKLIDGVGWRSSLLISGTAVMLVTLVTAFFVQERPAPGEHEEALAASRQSADAPVAAGSEPASVRTARVSEILRMPRFWIIAMSCCIPMGVTGAVMVSLYPFAIQKGFSPAEATGLMSVTGFSAIGGILLVSTVVDRFDRRIILASLFMIDALAAGLFPSGASYGGLVFAGLLLGISSSVLMPAMFTYVADVFGAASFGTAQGMMSTLVAIVGALLVRFAGEVYDRTGGYDVMFYSFVIAEVISAMAVAGQLFWTTKRELRPA